MYYCGLFRQRQITLLHYTEVLQQIVLTETDHRTQLHWSPTAIVLTGTDHPTELYWSPTVGCSDRTDHPAELYWSPPADFSDRTDHPTELYQSSIADCSDRDQPPYSTVLKSYCWLFRQRQTIVHHYSEVLLLIVLTETDHLNPLYWSPTADCCNRNRPSYSTTLKSCCWLFWQRQTIVHHFSEVLLLIVLTETDHLNPLTFYC